MKESPKSKHRAIVNLQIEVFPVLDSGECSGHPVTNEEMEKFKIKPSMLVSVDGFDRTECLRKLRRRIEEFNK